MGLFLFLDFVCDPLFGLEVSHQNQDDLDRHPDGEDVPDLLRLFVIEPELDAEGDKDGPDEDACEDDDGQAVVKEAMDFIGD